MKKQTIDILLKKSKNIWKKPVQKNIKIKINLVAGAAIKKPPLSSTLASIGVNVDNFIIMFNNKTKNIFGVENVIIPTIITITPAKTFEFQWKLPTISTLFKKMFTLLNKDNKKYLDNTNLFIALIYKAALRLIGKNTIIQNKKKENIITIYRKMHEILGSIKSWDIFKLADHSKDKKRIRKKDKNMVTIQQYLKGARITKKYRSSTPAFKGAPQKKGTVTRLDIVKPKKPNSAKRKVVKVRLRNKREILAYIPGIGHNVQKHADVLVRGGRVPDLPGVRYHLVRQKADFTAAESFERKNKRSKYGVKSLKKINLNDVI